MSHTEFSSTASSTSLPAALLHAAPLPLSALGHGAEYETRQYHVEVPPHVRFEDLFRAQLWSRMAQRLRVHDLIRAVGHNHAFDVQLTVVAIVPEGVILDEWPKRPSAESSPHAGATPEAVVTRHVGRPKGAGSYQSIDEPLLDEMEGMLQRHEVLSVTAAAERVAARATGNSLEAIIKRLVRAYRASDRWQPGQ